MAVNFFATDADLAEVWHWLFDVPGMRIFEEYSVPDQPNRWFGAWEEVAAYLAGGGHSLAAWPEGVGGRPHSRTIAFTPEAQREFRAKGRTILGTPALITMGRHNDQNGCLAAAWINFWNENGARQRSIYPEPVLDEIDWAAFRSITGKVQRQIAKAAPAKLRAYPIMPDAYVKLATGELKLWNRGEACDFASPLIVAK